MKSGGKCARPSRSHSRRESRSNGVRPEREKARASKLCEIVPTLSIALNGNKSASQSGKSHTQPSALMVSRTVTANRGLGADSIQFRVQFNFICMALFTTDVTPKSSPTEIQGQTLNKQSDVRRRDCPGSIRREQRGN